MSPGEIEALADALGGLVGVLQRARPEDRAALYHELNLQLSYDPTEGQVRASVDFARANLTVSEGGLELMPVA